MTENTFISNNNNISNKEIYFLEFKSFEEIYDSMKNGIYKIQKFKQDIQKFCIESEKNNYNNEKNEEYKIPEEKTLFEKFSSNKNIFDFRLSMSDLIIKYYLFANSIKPENKAEYNILNDLCELFNEINNSNLIIRDIQCLLDNGLFGFSQNNFFIFIFDISDKYFNQIFSFFDIKSYFLSNISNINIFITKLNDLINSYNSENKQFLFIRKISSLLSQIFIIFDNIKNEEEKHKIKIYKEKIINTINKEKIFEIFFSDEEFLSHTDILLNIFNIFPNVIDKEINKLIDKKDRQINKAMMKFIIKNANFLGKYIKEKTLEIFNDMSIENSYKFHLGQYINGKDRLINIYNKYKSNKKIINLLIKYLEENNKKEQAKLIKENKYNEKDEYELEEKFIEKNNEDKYFKLPKDYKIYYISGEDDNYVTSSLNVLDDIIINKLYNDKYMGIDTEWKSSQTFYELYEENLGISKTHNKYLADIIQIAGINHGFIFDVKSIIKNEKLKEKIRQIFSDMKFIGFEFKNDSIKLGEFFKEIIYKNEFIELSNIYKAKKNKKTPELKIITSEFFGKELDKRDQISDWSKRPLLKNQINYGILDAYVLILIYQKLTNI